MKPENIEKIHESFAQQAFDRPMREDYLALEALKKQQAKGELPKLAKQALQKP